MALYHCSTKPLARSAAAAHRSGDCLVDQQQGLKHDEVRRFGVLHTQLILPEGSGESTGSELWNTAEKAEKRKEARTSQQQIERERAECRSRNSDRQPGGRSW